MRIAIGLNNVNNVDDIILVQRQEANCMVCKGIILPGHLIRLCKSCNAITHSHCAHIIPPDWKPSSCNHEEVHDFYYAEVVVGGGDNTASPKEDTVPPAPNKRVMSKLFNMSRRDK